VRRPPSDFFIEEELLGYFFRILDDRVNNTLEELELKVPRLEIGGRSMREAVCPDIYITGCERTEKERIIRMDGYSVTLTFPVPESDEADLYCYAYAAAFEKALDANPSLSGFASRAVITGKKYIRPKKPGCGEEWKLVLSVRVTVEHQHPC
jgi:hypothetical protein